MTPLFGPGWGNYAIQGIVEISLPSPAALLPATPGWWLLLAAGLLYLLRDLRRRWRRYQRNGYRRAALGALEELRQRFDQGDRRVLRELAPLLRSCVLNASGQRREFASSDAKDWENAVAALAPTLEPLSTDRLHSFAYRKLDDADLHDAPQLFEQLREWLQQHECVDA